MGEEPILQVPSLQARTGVIETHSSELSSSAILTRQFFRLRFGGFQTRERLATLIGQAVLLQAACGFVGYRPLNQPGGKH